ncbi:L-Ala-D/L-amino acid epimerase-like [Triticum dicoccoides]|uniref:L-Ala-D/L-amino acid epimerase-like n=1 Tax=Triticum dicoccoides TaxID=85692 RepID=UPI0018905C29|nr:L-Ala-D/L-amino acid epimerase-like [Triticum dicoccoides]
MRPPRSNPLLLSFSLADPLHSRRRASRLRTISLSPSPSPSLPTLQQPMEAFGFDALKETFSVDVAAAEARPLNVPLATPLNIAPSRLEDVANVAVRVELSSGAVGWGEAPALPSVTAEDQPAALAAIARACVARTATLGAVRAELSSGAVGWGEALVLPSVTAEDQPAALAAIARACVVRTATLGAVRAELSSGAVGWGEARSSPPSPPRTTLQRRRRLGRGPVLPSVTAEEQPAALAAIAHACVARTATLGAVRAELSSGAVGWGEAPVLPSVTAEEQPAALAAIAHACAARTAPLGAVLQDVADALPGHTFTSYIPIVTPNEAAQLAAKYRGQGFQTLKLKVGKNLNSDIEVLKAIWLVHPDCSFILDANEGYTANHAIEVLNRLNEMGVTPVLFEQPVHRDDWEGLHDVSIAAMEKYRVAVAADESCRGLLDARKIIHGNLAHVINIKPEKLGVLGALEVIDAARKAGIALMIGGMVETRIAMGFAGHLATGLDCFSFWTCLQFKNARGHGGFLHLDNNNGWVCHSSLMNRHFR